MRLDQTSVAQHLAKGLQPIYVLLGPEPLAMSETLDAIRAAARQQGYEERTSLVTERYFKWEQISYFGQATSLFASLRLLEIQIPTGKPGIEGGNALKALSESPIPDTTVVITLPVAAKEVRNSAWYKSLESNAVIITLNDVSLAQLPKWIANRLAKQNQSTDEASLVFLANQVEGNLLAANQEIQKLGLLFPNGALTLDQVKASVLSVSRYDAFQLSEAVLTGDTPRTVRVLQGLQDEGEQPLAVLNPLLWTLRPLAQLKLAQARGENLNQAMTHARIFGQNQSLVKRALSKLSTRQIEATLQRLSAIDQTAKGVMEGDAWLEISRLCFGLSKVCAR